VGGNANNSGNTGAFYVNANNTSGNANQNIGSQLSLFNIGLQHKNLAAWQNTKKSPIGAGRRFT